MKCASSILIIFLLFACKSHKEVRPVSYVLKSNVKQTYIKNFHKGLRLKMSARFIEAIECFKTCINSDENKDAPHHALSECYLAISDYQNAIIHTQKAAQLDPNNMYYLEELAYMYKEIKNYDKSLASFKKLIKNDSKNLAYLYDYANVLALSGKSSDAIKALNQFESINGPSSQIAITKFQLYSSLDKKEEAINVLKNAILIDPTNSHLLSALFEYYIYLNKYDEAFIEFKSLVLNDPKNMEALYLFGELHQSFGEKEIAFEAYKTCILGDFDINKKIMLLDRLLRENNNKKEEIIYLINSVIKTHPKKANLYALKGNYYLLYKDNKKALNAYKESIQNDPSPFSIWKEIFLLESKMELYQQLFDDTKKASELFPSFSLVWFYKGHSANKLKKYDQAINAFESGILYHTNEAIGIPLWEYQFQLSEAYLGKNDIYKASQIIKEAYESNPNETKLILKNALLMAYLKTDLEKALVLTDKLIKDNKHCSIINLKGYILFQQQKYNLSITLLESILTMNECKAKTIELLGDCYFKLGNKTKALNNWKKSRDLGKNDETLIKKITDERYYE